jgi:hypothetical protein
VTRSRITVIGRVMALSRGGRRAGSRSGPEWASSTALAVRGSMAQGLVQDDRVGGCLLDPALVSSATPGPGSWR